MRKTNCLNWIAPVLVATGLCETASAQTSLADVYSTIQSTNSSLWRSMENLRQTEKRTEALGSPAPVARQAAVPQATAPQVATPAARPITDTDFQPYPGRILLDQVSASIPSRQQKLEMRTMYNTVFAMFESERRKYNIAAAAAWAVGISLEIERGREPSEAEYQQLTWYFNQALATSSQFYYMQPQQKQILYESLIMTGGTAAVLAYQGTRQNDAAMQQQARELARTILSNWPPQYQ